MKSAGSRKGFGDIRIEDLGHSISDVPGVIMNISHGAIHVKTSQFLPAKSVRVWFSQDCHMDGQLIFCRADEDAYLTGIVFPPDIEHQKRSELRIPLPNDPAVVTYLEGPIRGKVDAQAIDISRSGLGLLVDRQLTVNTWVKVELPFAIVFGEIMYSRPETRGGFRVGLRLETLLMRDGSTGESARKA